jgi:hypothetical protein
VVVYICHVRCVHYSYLQLGCDFHLIIHSQGDDNEGLDLSDDAAIEADDSDIDDSFVGVLVFEEKKRKSFSCLSPPEIVAYPLLFTLSA